MSVFFYDFLHVVGVMFLFAGFGALLSAENRSRAMMLHGIGLVILLVAGFGILAKNHPAAPAVYSYTAPWVLAKLVIWLILGALPVLAKKRVLPVGGVITLAIVLGSAAAYLCFFKPGV